MQKSKSLLGVFTLSAIVALSGCKAMSSSSSSSLQGEEIEFFSSSGAGACAIGAVGGAILGVGGALLSGADTGTVVAVGVGAAAAGCGAAMGADYYLEKQRKTYSNKESRLKSYIADTRKNSQMVERATNKARNQLAKNNQLMADLNRQLKSGKIQKAEAEKQLARVDEDLKVARNTLEGMKQREKTLRDVARQEKASGVKVGKFEAEIASLNKKIAAYEKIVLAYAKQRSAIQVG